MRFIEPSRIDGVCRAPSSKSQLQRAIAAASLSPGRSEVIFSNLCDDSKAALGIVESLGASVRISEGRATIEGGRRSPASSVDCRESGLCLRMFAPIAALFDREITLTGRGSILRRPVSMVEAALKNAGAVCRSREGFPPLAVRGPLAGGRIHLDGSLTSQHITGFLMALPVIQMDSDLRVERLHSSPYLKLTLAVMAAFGIEVEADFDKGRFTIPGSQSYRPIRFTVEGDWSAAAFLLVAGAVAGRAVVTGLNLESHQADKAIIDVLRGCGARVSFASGAVVAGGGLLSALDFDATNAPDLVPPLAVLACFCRGTSRIHGIARLRHKESDRGQALIDVLGGMGGRLKMEGDTLKITGSGLRGGRADSHHDHRIAMAAAVAGLASETGVEISDPDCVAKSYPGFFEDLAELTKTGGAA